MTVAGHLGAIPDRKRLYDNGCFIPYWMIGEGIIKIEHDGQKKGICTEDILHTSTKTKKQFFNQSSLVFRLRLPDGTWKETNIKLFKDGGFQMTGISSEAMGRAAIQRLMDLNKDRGIWLNDKGEPAEPYLKTFNICMMNSDYSIGKAIRRDRLYKILVETFGLWSSFEPTIYQGVNTKFFWNKNRPAAAPPGICVCPTPCEGDGSGYGIGHCKKITISPFRTGSIIITGAQQLEQLQDAYEFMNGVLQTYAAEVLRDEPAAEPKRKTVATPTTPEGILRQKMRASPRNVLRLAVP
jgi:Transcription factor TFIID (or TATA-binding protein, TBP)